MSNMTSAYASPRDWFLFTADVQYYNVITLLTRWDAKADRAYHDTELDLLHRYAYSRTKILCSCCKS